MRVIDKELIHKDFGEYIAEARRKQKLYQAELATKAGISQSYLSRMENGQRDIDLSDAIRLCKALDIPLADFVDKYM